MYFLRNSFIFEFLGAFLEPPVLPGHAWECLCYKAVAWGYPNTPGSLLGLFPKEFLYFLTPGAFLGLPGFPGHPWGSLCYNTVAWDYPRTPGNLLEPFPKEFRYFRHPGSLSGTSSG